MPPGMGCDFRHHRHFFGGRPALFFPRVLFEPPPTFKIGTLDDYPGGEADEHGVVSVSEKYMASERVWIVREADRIYAIFGKCTHLGCTPKWFPDERQFKCPCHGSMYYSNGVNFAGPAPRPMDRYGIRTLEDGRLQVDKSELYTVAWAITVGTNMGAATPVLGAEGPFSMTTKFNDERFVLLGGTTVGANALLRFYVLHVIAVPAIACVFMAIHFWRIRKDGGISRPL